MKRGSKEGEREGGREGKRERRGKKINVYVYLNILYYPLYVISRPSPWGSCMGR